MSKPFMCGDEVAVYVPEGGCDCNYTLQRVESDQYAYAYKLLMNGTQVGDLITVPFDKYVNACQLKTVDMAGYPYPDAQIGDAYLDMTFQNYPEHIYVSLASIMGGGYLIVDELPQVGDPRYIYLVDDGQGNYDRYVWDKDAEDWVNIGGTSIDLSNYYTKTEIDNLIWNIMLRFYPVGAIYTSIDDTDPGTLFGGTWTRLTDTFLYAVPSGQSDQSATTKTDGSKDAVAVAHTHTISSFSVTSNNHHHGATANGSNPAFLAMHASSASDIGVAARRVSSNASGSGNAGVPGRSWGTSYGYDAVLNTANATVTTTIPQKSTASQSPTASATNANMPPYMKVYMWKRTA